MENNFIAVRKNEERMGDGIGLVMWIIWLLGISAIISILNFDGSLSDFSISPEFLWIRIGPIFIFMFVGRYIKQQRGMKTNENSRTVNNNLINAAFSFGIFFIWLIVNLVCSNLNIGLTMINNIVGGLGLCYLSLVIYNKKWIR